MTTDRIAALEAELDRFKSVLSDPIAVWANMLRGSIAFPEHLKAAEAANAALVLENEGLRKALSRLVADYGDVPDATDVDGQAVFDDARVFLSRPSPSPSAVAEVVRLSIKIAPMIDATDIVFEGELDVLMDEFCVAIAALTAPDQKP
jgi:hypothetical protein